MTIDVSDLSFHYPDGTPSVQELSFKARVGEVTAIVGPNGVGKTTLLELIVGSLKPSEGVVNTVGEAAYMRQNPGFNGSESPTVGDALALGLPAELRRHADLLSDLYRRSASDSDPDDAVRAAMALGDALEVWGSLGGYEIEAKFDQITQSVLRQGYSSASGRLLSELSGGERKRLILGSFLASPVPVLLLDEPDNFLDLHGKAWLDQELQATKKTVLMVSHDRSLLTTAVDRMLVLEHNGYWMHGGTYATLKAARRDRAERLAKDLGRWKDEERRLFQFYKIMKQRASLNPKNAKRADAAQTRWEKFRDAGPPTPPPPEREITTRFVGSRSGNIAMKATGFEVPGLFLPFDLTVWNEDRILLLGENGVGKSTLLRMLRDAAAASGADLDDSSIRFGPTARVSYFSQENQLSINSEFMGDSDPNKVPLLEVVAERYGNDVEARKALGRYGLSGHIHHTMPELSGGQKARVQLILLETERPNVMLLDEPTDNLDLESILAIELALAELEATLITISHDKEFAAGYSRFILFDRDGLVAESDEIDMALDIAAQSNFSLLDFPELQLLTSP